MVLEFAAEGGRRTPRKTWPPLSKNVDDPEPEVSEASARWSRKRPDFWFTRHGCLMDVTPLLLCLRFSLLLLTCESPKPNEAYPFSPIQFCGEFGKKKTDLFLKAEGVDAKTGKEMSCCVTHKIEKRKPRTSELPRRLQFLHRHTYCFEHVYI